MKKIIALVMAIAAVSAVFGGTKFAEEALMPYIESGALPGAISVFEKPGEQDIACVGWADVDKKRPITLDSHFMQCSQTKGFCGVTIAMLVEEGKISLDDPVSKYLPEFENLTVRIGRDGDIVKIRKAENVLTIRMCMNHTGGFDFELPNYRNMGGWSRRMPLRSVAAIAAAQPLLFEPGTKVKYSNVGIDIGAAIVERVTGKRWEDFLKERVLDPLGMSATWFWPSEEQLAGKIEMYKMAEGRAPSWRRCDDRMHTPYSDDRVFPSAGAGLWTTTRDQLKFYRMLMNLGVGENGVRILKEETVQSLLAVSTRPDEMSEGYSLGLKAPKASEDGDDAWFGHGGAWGTNCMVNWRRKELKLWVVQQGGNPRPWEAARDEAADKFFAHEIDNSGADAYTGRVE